jgi:2-keto-4-pentenoate hydratase/2-oxohepta-3-ene-1,7-dioic acid hydratase in catechol pathway
MKIICIGFNYVKHTEELKSDIPQKPIFFLKPDSAILRNNNPFYLPDFSKEIHHEVEIVLKINRLGKNIASKFAYRYFEEIGIGIDFTARDLQNECKAKGLPWEISKVFDYSAAIGKFFKKDVFNDLKNIHFNLSLNGNIVQKGCTADMIFGFDEIIAYVSQFMTLRTGDLIYTGTPAGVGSVKIGDRLQAYIEEKLMLDFFVK